MLDINFGGVVNGTRAFLPILLRQDSGVIVNISSVFGLVGFPHQSAYCASKFAVRGFTESLRQELRGHGRARRRRPSGRREDQHRAQRALPRATRTARHVARGGGARVRLDRLHHARPAAKIIHEGVKAGRSRILVGPDAYLFDALARLAPTRYFDVLAWLDGLAARRA